ncbi:hypothetical protein ACQZV8_20575, partial [Magnetococcales bacterium HHB-1]
YSDLYKPQASGWKIAKKSIKRLAHYSQKNQIPLIFINYPELHELKNYPFQKVNQQLQQLTKQEAIPYIDLLPSIKDEKPESLWVSPGDAHPNAKANQRYTQYLLKQLPQYINLN